MECRLYIRDCSGEAKLDSIAYFRKKFRNFERMLENITLASGQKRPRPLPVALSTASMPLIIAWKLTSVTKLALIVPPIGAVVTEARHF